MPSTFSDLIEVSSSSLDEGTTNIKVEHILTFRWKGSEKWDRSLRKAVDACLEISYHWTESFRIIAIGIGAYFVLMGTAKVIHAIQSNKKSAKDDDPNKHDAAKSTSSKGKDKDKDKEETQKSSSDSRRHRSPHHHDLHDSASLKSTSSKKSKNKDKKEKNKLPTTITTTNPTNANTNIGLERIDETPSTSTTTNPQDYEE